jgi:hypothetical protein
VNVYLFQAPVQVDESEDTILAVSRRERSLGSWGIALPCPSSTIISTDIEQLRRQKLISNPVNVTSRHQGLGEDVPVIGHQPSMSGLPPPRLTMQRLGHERLDHGPFGIGQTDFVMQSLRL